MPTIAKRSRDEYATALFSFDEALKRVWRAPPIPKVARVAVKKRTPIRANQANYLR